MNQNFDKCMEMLLHHEGGFVNHPSDPGGMTNLGVTKKTWDEFYGDDIDEEQMRNITVDDIKPIYKTMYWDRCRCGDLPSGVDWAVFDWAVNSGPGRAAKALQRAVGAYEDGAAGPTDTDGRDSVTAPRNHQPNSGTSRQFLSVAEALRHIRSRLDQAQR